MENINLLINSKNEQDIRLGFILARESKISPKKINEMIDGILIDETKNRNIILLAHEYLKIRGKQYTFKGERFHSKFYKWIYD